MNIFHVPDSVSGISEETPGPAFMEFIVQPLLFGLETEFW